MSKICPQCGNLNDDDKKICTSCGNAFVLSSDESESSTMPQAGLVPAGAAPDPNRLLKILAGSGIAIVMIIAVFLFLTNPGIKSILLSTTPPLSTHVAVAPTLTSSIIVETPEPEQTRVPTENLSPTTPVPDTSRIRPTSTKALVCSSDRRACGATCTDTMTDPANCGACGIFCSSKETCVQGHCRGKCTAGQTSCFDGCHDLLYDTENCGICGNSCQGGLVCNKSICALPLTTVIPTYEG
jgi:hypothetical protein